MKISWIISLLIIMLTSDLIVTRSHVPTKDFIRNKRMHSSKSLRDNVTKYLKKISKAKRKQIRMNILKKKKKFSHLKKHDNLRHRKNYGLIQRNREINMHQKMRKFEHMRSVRKRKLKKLELKKKREKRRREEIIKRKKEKRNLDELKRRMARKNKGQSLRHNVYPINKAKKTHLITHKNHSSIRSRFLKSKKQKAEQADQKNTVNGDLPEGNHEQKVNSENDASAPRDLDDDLKLKDHSSLKTPTKSKIYATKPVLKEENPNAIKIDRKLLEVSDYADYSPKNLYASQQACQMQQKQSMAIAREIVTQQSRRLYEKLTNYLLKGKLLVNMTKQKVNKALAGKIKEMLKPGHVGFTMADIEDVEHEFQNPMDEDLSEAEDYVTKETYSDFKGFDDDDVPKQEKVNWNLN